MENGSAEFVNAFIQRQKSFIEDLIAQKLITETRLSLIEDLVKQQEKTIEDLTNQLSSFTSATTEATVSSANERPKK
jgi:hypothetical protein